MKINKTSLKKLDSNIIFISNNKAIFENIEKKFNTWIKKLNDSEEEFSYLKTNEEYIFAIKEKLQNEKYRIFGHKIRTILDKQENEIFINGNNQDNLYSLTEGFCLSSYQFIKYRKEHQKLIYKLENIFLPDNFSEKSIDKLQKTIETVFWARNMVNEPVSYLTATVFSEEINLLFNDVKNTKVNILEKQQIESLKMGGLLAVNKGSQDPPTFTIIEYKPKKCKNKKPIVLVGKGVTYDTGGLSLKPTLGSMDSMKSDMAGAAMMVGVINLCARLELPLHLICLIPATDNRPGENAYTPGDIINIMDGSSIEVLNTDAEGRLILADALAYSKKYEPELVINSATLTGAAVVAIGTKASCMMSNAESSINKILVESGDNVHERLVELPFWDEYLDEMKSQIADLKNIGGKYAGMITAGKFLEYFAPKPFIHIDIAGPSFLETEENYKGKGGTGVGIRLLTDFFENYPE